MLEHVETVFNGMLGMMKGLKKAAYEKNMKSFREENGHFFREMGQYVKAEEDKERAAKEIGDIFVKAVNENFAVKGRIKSKMQADLNFFMIYYVFPALLLEENEYGVLIADSIRDKWSAAFKDSNIQYADYDRIYGAFHEKIFGLF